MTTATPGFAGPLNRIYPGDYVLDPFLGSGTTAAAAALIGRAWGGVELVADNLPIIRRRSLTARGAAAHWTDALPAQQRADLAMALMRLGGETGQNDEALLEAGEIAARPFKSEARA